jgi:hypothetical protein
MTLPRSFVRAISDRISCGLAIILRASYPYFEHHHNQEWSLVSEMFDLLANYSTSRVLVFDGIASTVEYAMPNFNPITAASAMILSNVDSTDLDMEATQSRPSLSLEACSALSRILTRFVLGFYQGDQSLTVPAMLCLEKVYRRKVEILLGQPHQSDDGSTKPMAGTSIPKDSRTATPAISKMEHHIASAPDKELWQNVTVAIYSVCRSTDPDASTVATRCYRRIVLRTSVEEIAMDKWMTILYLMVNKQPPIVSEVSRANTFSVLGQLVLRIVPQMSHIIEHREDLEEFLIQYATLAEENIQSAIQSRLRNGTSNGHHHGHKSIMLDKTIQTLTFISNHIMTDEWNGEREFSLWMNETLMTPIDRASQNGGGFLINSGHGKVVTTFDNTEELDDVSEISDSVAGDEY